MAESVIDKIRRLDLEKQRLLDEAKQEALAKANAALAELRELGLDYRLVEGSAARATSRSAPVSARSAARRPKTGVACPVCGFATEPPHDKRSHRSHPGPFTEQELAQKGWRKVQ